MLSLMLNAAAAPATPAEGPSQLLVLGMHHSGTSLVSNLTMMMGAYGGARDELLLHPENPLKFWERRDVVALDEARLDAGVREEVAERYQVPNWIAYGFDAAHKGAGHSGAVHEMKEAKAIVENLNAHRPWVTKDPRMCLVASEWMELLDAPACVIVHREPLSIANSMMIYSHNVSLAEWSSVYEAYYASVVAACDGKPTVVVQHEELMRAPYEAVRKLHRELTAAGVQGLTLPAESRVAALIAPSAKKSPLYLGSEKKVRARRRPPPRRPRAPARRSARFARPTRARSPLPSAPVALSSPPPRPRAPRPAATPSPALSPSSPPPLRR